ncbi:MAG: VapC toxin family PIN domain ribonuclease [Thauera sp.]|nr:VapC toxin family PIN domain ribonuclease [Thauera sp.]
METLTTSSWPVLTEVSHMLDFSLQAQLGFLAWVERGAIQIGKIEQGELFFIRQMMEKYGDLPMDLADASLLYLGNKENIRQIISIDSDFDVYRTLKERPLKNLLHA